jgi:hypothetical protein
MTSLPRKLTLEAVEEILRENGEAMPSGDRYLYEQLRDTIRENERLEKVIKWAKDNAEDCCGKCYSFKSKGQFYNDDHCKDAASPFPIEHVEKDWWCPRFSPR